MAQLILSLLEENTNGGGMEGRLSSGQVVSPALAESEGQRLMKEAPGLEGGGVG